VKRKTASSLSAHVPPKGTRFQLHCICQVALTVCNATYQIVTYILIEII